MASTFHDIFANSIPIFMASSEATVWTVLSIREQKRARFGNITGTNTLAYTFLLGFGKVIQWP